MKVWTRALTKRIGFILFGTQIELLSFFIGIAGVAWGIGVLVPERTASSLIMLQLSHYLPLYWWGILMLAFGTGEIAAVLSGRRVLTAHAALFNSVLWVFLSIIAFGTGAAGATNYLVFALIAAFVVLRTGRT